MTHLTKKKNIAALMLFALPVLWNELEAQYVKDTTDLLLTYWWTRLFTIYEVPCGYHRCFLHVTENKPQSTLIQTKWISNTVSITITSITVFYFPPLATMFILVPNHVSTLQARLHLYSATYFFLVVFLSFQTFYVQQESINFLVVESNRIK